VRSLWSPKLSGITETPYVVSYNNWPAANTHTAQLTSALGACILWPEEQLV